MMTLAVLRDDEINAVAGGRMRAQNNADLIELYASQNAGGSGGFANDISGVSYVTFYRYYVNPPPGPNDVREPVWNLP